MSFPSIERSTSAARPVGEVRRIRQSVRWSAGNGNLLPGALDPDPSSLLAKHQIHDPATADVRPRPAAVVEDVVAVAPSVLECVGQNGHAVEGALLVDAT